MPEIKIFCRICEGFQFGKIVVIICCLILITVSSSPKNVAVDSSPPNSTPPLSQEQLERISRNREAAIERQKKRAEEAELDFLIDIEARDLEEQEKRGRTSTSSNVDNSFGGFAYADGIGPPNAKRAKHTQGKESQLMTDMRNVVSEGSIVRIQGTKVIDTGGGFLIEEGDLVEAEEEERVLTVQPASFIPTDVLKCEECGLSFSDSYLLLNFDHQVCDSCKDMEEKHKLITKTEAKNVFLLKDVDLEKREPILKFISRPNPHNNRWGDMKLYLRLQVEKRAIKIWGSLEAIEEQLELREDNRVKTKIKKYSKKMKSLRMTARSSLYTRDLGPHEHTWGPDICVDEDEDLYKHECTECGQEETFEKM